MTAARCEQLERELKITEASLKFLKKEHSSTLTGLHQEIARLTHKCSELQFSLVMQTKAGVAEEVLKQKFHSLILQTEEQEKRLQEQEEELERSRSKEKEFVEQLSWERLQNINQLESLTRQLQDKEKKILELQRKVVLEVDVAKLQAKIHELYKEGTVYNQERIHQISTRARAQGREAEVEEQCSDSGSIDSASSVQSVGSQLSSLHSLPSVLPAPHETPTDEAGHKPPRSKDKLDPRRSRVFRHQLRRLDNGLVETHRPSELLLGESTRTAECQRTSASDYYRPTPPPGGRNSCGGLQSPGLYCYSNPPLSLSTRERQSGAVFSSLPPDYKANVSSLPPIGAFQNNPGNQQWQKSLDVVSLVFDTVLPSDGKMRNLSDDGFNDSCA